MEAKVSGGFSPIPDIRAQQTEIIPISNEEFELLKVKLKEALVAKLPELNEISRQIAENNKKIDENNKKFDEINKKFDENNKKIDENNKKFAENNREIKVAQEMQLSGLTKTFYTVFKSKTDPAAKDLPAQEIDRLFQIYLADGSLSIEKPSEGPVYSRINSMKAVAKYLDDHPKVSTCNFTAFKTEVHDVPTLTEYLKHSTVRLVVFRTGISEEAKAGLAEAVAARKGGLKVQYL